MDSQNKPEDTNSLTASINGTDTSGLNDGAPVASPDPVLGSVVVGGGVNEDPLSKRRSHSYKKPIVIGVSIVTVFIIGAVIAGLILSHPSATKSVTANADASQKKVQTSTTQDNASSSEIKTDGWKIVSDKKLSYSYRFPMDGGSLLYRQLTHTQSDLPGSMVEINSSKHPAQDYAKTLFDVSVAPIGSAQDHSASEAKIKADIAAHPEEGGEIVQIPKPGASGICIKSYTFSTRKYGHLNCRYEYKGMAYGLYTGDFDSPSNDTFFAGAATPPSLLAQAALESFMFLP
jgi:hypothetical protein